MSIYTSNIPTGPSGHIDADEDDGNATGRDVNPGSLRLVLNHFAALRATAARRPTLSRTFDFRRAVGKKDGTRNRELRQSISLRFN